MNYFEQHKDFYGQPVRITEEQRKEPIEVFRSFFSDYALYEARQSLAELLEVALTSDNNEFADPQQRASIFLFCKELEEILEAAFLLARKK